VRGNILPFKKMAQRALGPSPEEKAKGHKGSHLEKTTNDVHQISRL